MAALADKVQKIQHELGLDASLSMAEALQSANEIMGLRPSNYTLQEQADLLLNVRYRPAHATDAHGPSLTRVPTRAQHWALHDSTSHDAADDGLHRPAASAARRGDGGAHGDGR